MNKSVLSLKNIAKIAILAALSAIIMQFRFPLPFAPGFLDFDLAEVPSLIGAFAMGPVQGLIIVILKNILKVLISGTNTSFVGEFSNIIVNGALVLVAGFYYRHDRTFRGAIIAMILGVIALTSVATLSNYFVMFPLYANVLGWEIQQIVDMAAAVNPLVNSLETVMLFTIVPFNLITGISTSIVTTLIYPHISPILKR